MENKMVNEIYNNFIKSDLFPSIMLYAYSCTLSFSHSQFYTVDISLPVEFTAVEFTGQCCHYM